jgi:hypothetical protein
MTDATPITDAQWHALGDLPIPWKERHRWMLAPLGLTPPQAHRWARGGDYDRIIQIGDLTLVRQRLPPPNHTPWPGLDT